MKKMSVILLSLILLAGCGNELITNTSSNSNSITSSFDSSEVSSILSSSLLSSSIENESSNVISSETLSSLESDVSSSVIEDVFYSATFLNYDGKVLYIDEYVLEGSIPEYKGETPTKKGDYKTNYVFTGWDSYLEPIYENMIYTALFKEEELFYTVEELISFNGDYPIHYGKEVFLEDVGIVSIYSEDTFTVTPVHNPLDPFSIEVKAKENIKDTFTSSDVVTIVGTLDVINGRAYINDATVNWGYDGDKYSADDAAFIGTVEMKDREYFENKIDKKDSGNLYYSYMTMASIPDIVSGKDISFYITFPGEDIEISDNNFYLIETRIPSLTENEAEYVTSWASQFKKGDGIYINLQIFYDNKIMALLPYDLIKSTRFNVPYTHENVFSSYEDVSSFVEKQYSKEYIIFPNMENDYTYNYVTKSKYETVGNTSMKYCSISFYTYKMDEVMNYLINLYDSSEDFTCVGLDNNGKYWIDHDYSLNLDMHICIYKGFGKVIVEMHFLK